jgi:hypothetical protein
MMMQQETRTAQQQQAERVMISRLDALLNGAQLDEQDDDDDVQRDSGNSSDFSSSGISVDEQKTTKTRASNVNLGVECSNVSDSMFDDDRVLSNLVYLEDYYRIHSNYFMFTQAEIKPWMHKTLACWMLEVNIINKTTTKLKYLNNHPIYLGLQKPIAQLIRRNLHSVDESSRSISLSTTDR